MKYKNIIFDLDGTLLNTLLDLHASVNYSMDKLGFPRRTVDEVRRFVGNGVKVLIRRAAPDDISDEQYNAAYAAFQEHYRVHSRDKTAPYDGVCELMKELKARGHKVAIVSNKLDFAVQTLKDEFFSGLCDAAVGDSDATRTKPEPDMVYKALDEMDASADESVYIGDTDVDLATAKNSGMPCISVTWGFRSRAELEGYGAETIVDSADEILELV